MSKRSRNAGRPRGQAANGHSHEQQAADHIRNARFAEAEAIYRRLIDQGSKNYLVYANLAGICGLQGRRAELIALLQQSLALNPDYAEAHNNLGNALKDQGDIAAAISCYNKALALQPDHPDFLNNLGVTYHEQGEYELATASLRRAIKLRPDFAEAHNNLGNALYAQGELSEAIACFETALRLRSDFPEADYNLGSALLDKGDLPDARAAYRKVLESMPDNSIAQFNLAMAELALGDYESGWRRFEYRFQGIKGRQLLDATPACSQWEGQPLSATEPLLVVSEQGLGDTLHFMRYVIALRQRGFSVSFCAPSKLHALIRSSGIDPAPLTPEQANEWTDGWWTPLLSVPRHLGVSSADPLFTEPYIRAPDHLVARWRDALAVEAKPVVAINWQGNISIEVANFAGRSVPLEAFAPIAEVAGVSLLSLQKGSGSEQFQDCSFQHRFVHCQDRVDQAWDFLETAAIIANCDLVITSDTSVAHLAAGMGKTTWLLLKQVPEWRWGLEGETTFWYPSMRLFRQKERGNWQEVLERVAVALEARFAAPRTERPEVPTIQVPITLGELVDRIAILQVQADHLQGSALHEARHQLSALEEVLVPLAPAIEPALIQRLEEVHRLIRGLEEEIRDQENLDEFGETFIHHVRSLMRLQERRTALRQAIDTASASAREPEPPPRSS